MRVCVYILMLFMCATEAAAEGRTFGPFSVDVGQSVITLDGDIDAGAALNFRRALSAAPSAKLLVLNSDGGLVAMALLIADDVHSRKLSTLIPKGSHCYSACSLIFLAGEERQVDGDLGVHQISSDSGNLVSAQYSISDILDVLNRFDTPIEVLTIMFRTPPDDMYVFSSTEIERIGLNRRQSEAKPADLVEDLAPTSSPAENQAPEATGRQAGVQLDTAAATELSAIEGFTRKPNRLAIYRGLDFFGADIGTARSPDASTCARECLALGERCRAFTFNTDDRVVRGPNCFMKEHRGVSDGNSVAISGELLRASDRDPSAFSMGVIDPKSGVYENVDIPGGDLSSRPALAGKTAQQCRLACVGNDMCIAFTFVKAKAECWLKGNIGTPRYMDGMISGAKTYQSFEPTSISLE